MSRWRLLTGRSTGSHRVPPAVVQAGREPGELHEVAEVLDGGVAPAFVEATDEGRAVGRREHHVRPADAGAALGIACVLHELRRRGFGDELAGEPTGDPDPLGIDVGTGAPPKRQRLGVIAELDADLLQDGLRVVLDELQALGGHHVVDRHAARHVRHDGRSRVGARGAACLPAAAASSSPSSLTRHVQASCQAERRRPGSGPSIGVVPPCVWCPRDPRMRARAIADGRTPGTCDLRLTRSRNRPSRRVRRSSLPVL